MPNTLPGLDKSLGLNNWINAENQNELFTLANFTEAERTIYLQYSRLRLAFYNLVSGDRDSTTDGFDTIKEVLGEDTAKDMLRRASEILSIESSDSEDKIKALFEEFKQLVCSKLEASPEALSGLDTRLEEAFLNLGS